jgi:hypothetical protein
MPVEKGCYFQWEKPKHNDMYCLTLNFHHLPTDTIGKRQLWITPLSKVYELLNHWNNHPNWKYWV